MQAPSQLARREGRLALEGESLHIAEGADAGSQQLDDLRVAFLYGNRLGRATGLVARLEVRALLDQHPDHLGVTGGGGEMQRGLALAVAGVDVGTVAEQQLDHFTVSFASSDMQ